MGEATAPLSYLWQVPGKRLSVSLSLDVVDRLSVVVLEGLQALPRRGLEIGGFLLGKTRRNGELVCVDVDNFEPLGCEHAVGPSYLLSPTDRASLEDRIRWHKSHGEPSIVGFYRSHTRKVFAATMEDVDALSAYFSDRSNVFLLIHAQRDAPLAAGFLIWEGRKICSLTPYLEFPFRRATLISEGHEILSRPSVNLAAREKRLEVLPQPAVLETPEALPATTRLPRPPRLPAALHMPKLPVSMSSVLRRPKMPEALSRLLRQRPASLKFDWLLAAAILTIAVFAGVLHRDYPPSRPSARPELRGARERKPTAGPVTAAPIREAPDTVPAAAEAPQPAIAAPALTIKAMSNSAQRAEPGRGKGDRTLASSTIRRIAAVPPEFVPAAAPPIPLLPEPPNVAAEPASYTELLSLGNKILRPELPQISDPSVSVAISQPHRGGFLRKLGLGKHNKDAGFVPPTPIREPPTELPPELRHRIKNQVAMDVKIYIDREGKVEYAELLSKGTGSNRDLASLAVFASRRWTFSPARLGDETVPAEVILHFRFGPDVR